MYRFPVVGEGASAVRMVDFSATVERLDLPDKGVMGTAPSRKMTPT
jgi:hypothetical protein